MNDDSESEVLAWVVTWNRVGAPHAPSSRACESEEDAQRLAAALRARLTDIAVDVAQKPDLTVDQVYPLFVACLGDEIRPGVISATAREGRAVELLVIPEQLVRRAYMEDDTADDRDLNVVPLARHPRRLGLMWLIGEVEDILSDVHPDKSQVDLRD